MQTFHKLKTTKKGAIGERIIEQFLQKWRWRYKAAPKQSHLVDFRAVTDKGEAVAVEVKTYPRRATRNDTGIDAADHKKYMAMECRVLLLFVDQFEQMIYGQWLDQLHVTAQDGNKVYFHLSYMKLVRALQAHEQAALSKYALDSRYKRTERYFSTQRVKNRQIHVKTKEL